MAKYATARVVSTRTPRRRHRAAADAGVPSRAADVLSEGEADAYNRAIALTFGYAFRLGN